MRAVLVVDLGFGDAGKGLVTDYLSRTLGATLNVRFNGGAQAGHNVVTPDGRHHTFSQLGSGSFVPRVRTFLAAPCAVHLTALLVESAHLESQGVSDPLSRLLVNRGCLVITPFHQAANRLRELARAEGRHGSCGVGFGEAVADARRAPNEAIRMGSFQDVHGTRRALRRQQVTKRDELASLIDDVRGLPGAGDEIRILEEPVVVERFLATASSVVQRITVVEDRWLRSALLAAPTAIFEGAQGVLLDEWLGFHPHTTYSVCTFENALELLRAASYPGDVHRLGVLRTYVVRHGAGPLPTEDHGLRVPEAHNVVGPWQGAIRLGWPDALLGKYAAQAVGGLDGLALTHLDAIPRVCGWRVCRRYHLEAPGPGQFELNTVDPKIAVAIHPPEGRDVDQQAALTRALLVATPLYEPVDWTEKEAAAGAIPFFEEAIGAPLHLASWGPTARDSKAFGGLASTVSRAQ